MSPSDGFYKVCYCLARVGIGIFYRLRVSGKEKVPSGSVMVCANHSSMLDPFFLAFAFGIKTQVHVIAKAELFKIPVISFILRRLGMIRVDRGGLDAGAIKKTLGFLNKGGIVAIFPEGTRSLHDDEVAAKTGAVRIAAHAGIPVIPAFIPRKKTLFGKVTLVLGEPYYIKKESNKRAHDDSARHADILMEKIKALNPEGAPA